MASLEHTQRMEALTVMVARQLEELLPEGVDVAFVLSDGEGYTVGATFDEQDAVASLLLEAGVATSQHDNRRIEVGES